MSVNGITLTVLATQLAEAVAKDETPEEGGCDMGAGRYGSNVSRWLRDVADALCTVPRDSAETCERAKLCATCARGLESNA